MARLNETQLERLSQYWRAQGADLLPHLAPGLTAEEAQALVAHHAPLRLPQELLTWWGWHNGASGRELALRREYFSLQDALESYASFMRIGEGERAQYLLPITSEWPAILIECHPDRPETGRVFTKQHAEAPTPALESVGDLVEIWLGFYRDGAWSFNSSGQAEFDHEKIAVPEHGYFF